MLVSFNYRPRQSLIEKFDPRARWLFSFMVLFSIVQFWDIRFLAFFLVLGFVQFALARLTWQDTRRAWIFILVLLTLMVVVNTLITSAGTVAEVMENAHPVWEVHTRLPLLGWTINYELTAERLWFALTQFVRVLSISALFIVLPFTMNPSAYGTTFRGLGLGDKVAYALDLSFRFVPTLSRDFSVTLDAQRARGYEIERVKGGLIAQIRRVAPLLIPVTMNAVLSGEDITNAMDLRCFGLRPRTWILELKYRWFDFALIGFGVFLLVGSLVLRYALGIGEFWIPAWAVWCCSPA
jgi:energy-coupling factor transport system permease protein